MLLSVQDLKTEFRTSHGVVKAVNGVSLEIGEREIVGLVGESGCGKSVTMLSVMQLVASPPGKIVGGKAFFEGTDLLSLKRNSREMRAVRGAKIAMIFQEPMTSLNPTLTIGRHLTEMLRLHLQMNKQAARRRAAELLKQVGIADAAKRLDDYPHQFSGGMRQRVMIALAISCHPKLIIADEPTTALDVTTQAQLLDLMQDMVDELGMSLILVTHNLGVVARYAHRIYVMYAGRVIEHGAAERLFDDPRHPYTIGLLQSVPRLDDEVGRKLIPIVGLPPHLIDMPPTCAFLPRCPFSGERCGIEASPSLGDIAEDHFVACHLDLSEVRHAVS